MAGWVWPVSESEAAYLAESGVTLCFPPGEPVELRVIREEAPCPTTE